MNLLELTAILGNLGEFLGSIAILVTLLYLASQIRLLRKQLSDEYMARVHDVYKSNVLNLLQDPSLDDVISRANEIADPASYEQMLELPLLKTLIAEDMSASEARRVHRYWDLRWLSVRELTRLASTEEERKIQVRSLAYDLQLGSGSLWWKGMKDRFLASEVHRKLAQDVQAVYDERIT